MSKIPAVWFWVIASGVLLLGCEPTIEVQEFEIGEDGKMIEVAPTNDVASADGEDGDKSIEENFLKKGEYAEAKEWLASKDENHQLWKVSRESANKFVDDLYKSGASKVFACFGERDPGEKLEMVATFVVELPKDEKTRKKVISAYNKFWKEYLREAEPDEIKEYLEKDTGQKYVESNFDL